MPRILGIIARHLNKFEIEVAGNRIPMIAGPGDAATFIAESANLLFPKSKIPIDAHFDAY